MVCDVLNRLNLWGYSVILSPKITYFKNKLDMMECHMFKEMDL